MAIRVVEGVPGSGKTYYAVNHLIRSYFDYDTDSISFKPKPEFENLVVITNIDSLWVGESLDDWMAKAGSLEQFFNYEFIEANFSTRKLILVIDEAQILFPFRFYQIGVFAFFQKHRHLGVDIYLVTQDVDLLAKGLRSLAEYHVRAVRRSLSVGKALRYKLCDPVSKESFQSQTLVRDPKISVCYRSMAGFETEKSPKIAVRYCVMAALAVGVTIFIAYGFMFKVHQAKASVKGSAPAVSKVPGKTLAVAPWVSTAPAPARVLAPAPAPRLADRILFVGVALLDDKSHYLFSVGSRSVVLSADATVALCKCDTNSLQPGHLLPPEIQF